MTREEFNSLIQEIGQTEDVIEAREKLATLSESYSPMFDSIENLTKQNTQLTDDNEKLREANMQLFLRVGSKTDKEARDEDNSREKEKEKLKFEDLFNEKGEIK